MRRNICRKCEVKNMRSLWFGKAFTVKCELGKKHTYFAFWSLLFSRNDKNIPTSQIWRTCRNCQNEYLYFANGVIKCWNCRIFKSGPCSLCEFTHFTQFRKWECVSHIWLFLAQRVTAEFWNWQFLPIFEKFCQRRSVNEAKNSIFFGFFGLKHNVYATC